MQHANELGINIAGQHVAAGERKTIMLPMPKLYDWTAMHMPVHVVCGKNAGPTLCITAAIHGDEVNGVEIIRRLMRRKFIKKISGNLITVPIVNVYGFLYQDRYLMDRRDLNRSFPGSAQGSLAARLAHQVTTELVDNATHFIDLHTGSLHRSNLPQIRANLDAAKIKKLAQSFGAPVVIHSKEKDGSLRQLVNDKSLPMLLYEAGQALRFDEISIKIGIKGIVNVMKALEMLPSDKKAKLIHSSSIARSSFWVRAHHSGVIRPYKNLGKRVKKDEVIAVIANPMGKEEYELLAPRDGIIIGKSNLPLAHAGAAIYNIACFEKLKKAASRIKSIETSYQPSTEEGIDLN